MTDDDGLPATRGEALRAGSRHYRETKRCRRGHLSMRLASNGVCMECHRVTVRAQVAARRETVSRRGREATS